MPEFSEEEVTAARRELNGWSGRRLPAEAAHAVLVASGAVPGAEYAAVEIIAEANHNTMEQWEGEAKRLRAELERVKAALASIAADKWPCPPHSTPSRWARDLARTALQGVGEAESPLAVQASPNVSKSLDGVGGSR